jgi:DNA-binding FadR family transcriptional regulator
VLDVRQGDGTYVTSLRPELLLDAVAFLADFHRDDSILHLLEVRRILEPAATAMAAQQMSDEAIEELGGVLGALPDDADIERLIATDLDFHRRIAAGSANPVLASLIDSMSQPTVRARIWRGIAQENAAAHTHEQHWAIFRAIRSRQPEVARAWAAVHIAGVEEWLRQAM